MVRITRPLYSDTATGRIEGLGSFRRARSGTFHLVNPPFPEIPRPSPDPVRAQHLAIAKKQHAQIPPTKLNQGGKWRWLIIPTWPDYWAQYQMDNGLPVSDRHGEASPFIGVGLSSTGEAVEHQADMATEEVGATITATAETDAAEAAAAALNVQSTLSATAHFQNGPP